MNKEKKITHCIYKAANTTAPGRFIDFIHLLFCRTFAAVSHFYSFKARVLTVTTIQLL